MKPSAPGVAQLGHLGQLLALEPARDRGEEADRDARLARAPRRAASASIGAESTTGSVFGIASDRAEAAGGGGARAGLEVLLVLLAGRAQVHVRVDERRAAACGPSAVDDLGAVGGVERSRLAELGDPPSRTQHVVRARRARARVEHVRAAQQQVGRRGAAARTSSRAVMRELLARCGLRRRRPRLPRGAGAGEQLVEHRHPHDDPGLDLLGDQRLRRVDDLAGELDAAVDRARVHQQLARRRPAAVDLVARPRTRAARARTPRSIRSRCIRSA